MRLWQTSLASMSHEDRQVGCRITAMPYVAIAELIARVRSNTTRSIRDQRRKRGVPSTSGGMAVDRAPRFDYPFDGGLPTKNVFRASLMLYNPLGAIS